MSKAHTNAFLGHDRGDNKAATHGIEKKIEEIFVIVQSNAITNPGTMVIHAADAAATDRAVVRPRWPNCLTFLTVAPNYQIQGFLRELGKYIIL